MFWLSWVWITHTLILFHFPDASWNFHLPCGDQRLWSYDVDMNAEQLDLLQPVFYLSTMMLECGYQAPVWKLWATRKRRNWFSSMFFEYPTFFQDCLVTSVKFLLLTSHKFLHPISVDIYQPLKEVAVNWIPPQSNDMLDTAGNAYHRRSSSANHS